MRPLRLTLILSCFVALPIFLTCLSLLSLQEDPADSFRAGHQSPPSRLRALFTFHTPSSLFPPSAIISLTYDNSTFFLARPAAFGPSLPSKGLSGQLWVGRGFGDEILNNKGDLLVSGWELGCSDVPGWEEDDKKHGDQSGTHDKPQAKVAGQSGKDSAEINAPDGMWLVDGDVMSGGTDDNSAPEEDGTDDHLHHPLPDSNPAKAAKLGEPANSDPVIDKQKKATHADIESLQESAAIAGKIVLLSRGGCGFLEKVKWAQRRGSIGVVVGDNERNVQLTIMYAKGDTSNVTIPAIFTSYTSAHLLSSLVPPEQEADLKQPQNDDFKNDHKKGNAGANDAGPTFTSLKTSTTVAMRPTIVPASSGQSTVQDSKGWAQNMMSVLGLADDPSGHLHAAEDSRRPPSSGNIDWVLVEDWDEEDANEKTVKGKLQAEVKSVSSKAKVTRSAPSSPRRPTSDDFVIGVQDWRDADLVAPKPAPSSKKNGIHNANGAGSNQQLSSSMQMAKAAQTDSFKGGSITPGSGEYDSQRLDESRFAAARKAKGQDNKVPANPEQQQRSWVKFWRWRHQNHQEPSPQPRKGRIADDRKGRSKDRDAEASNEQIEHNGLWVTLTPTSVSASPFFDTLLVLVVSPLVTLTVVYALLLLRSRIRRRRWRAPKSVVERLPVRTYHTVSTSSSTTSSQISSPNQSSPTSPLLRSMPQDIQTRSRPRSQTTTGVLPSASTSFPQPSPHIEKLTQAPAPAKCKRYAGRQVECVVCLEEYVDGESRVMSLPCGHEFHAECITPWLVTRRRTCPICKGDVVRSLARCGSGSQQELDEQIGDEETADDVQERVVEAVNSSPSAAIPIPVRDDNEELPDDGDVERGEDERGREPEHEGQPAPRSNWRNILSSSLSRLSGDTVWRSTTPDRSR